MYEKCFAEKGNLYLSVFDKYLIPDVSKIMVINILIVEKWSLLF